MITIKTYAAIDIGSNAMRLLVSNIVEQNGKETQFNKSSLVRVPVRLGQDAFTVGEISEENIQRMIDAMTAFRLLMKVHKVEKYMACATSAMREADNNSEIVDIIEREAGIKIQIIDGKKEAAIIYKTLSKAKKLFASQSANEITQWVKKTFKQNPNFTLEYFQIADEATLLPCVRKNKSKKYRAFIAVFVNNIRLIDTISLN